MIKPLLIEMRNKKNIISDDCLPYKFVLGTQRAFSPKPASKTYFITNEMSYLPKMYEF